MYTLFRRCEVTWVYWMKLSVLYWLALSRSGTTTIINRRCVYVMRHILSFWNFYSRISKENSLFTSSQDIIYVPCYHLCDILTKFVSGFGGLGVACWPLVPKFAGSNPAEAVGFLRAKKILSTPSFGGEVKPSVPCRRFATCKRSLNGAEVVISAKLPDNILAHISPWTLVSAQTGP